MKRAIALFLVSQAVVFAAVWMQSYQGRVALRRSQIQGCLRGRDDRVDENGTDLDLLRQGGTVADRARARIVRRSDRIVDCSKAFPAPTVLPHF